MKRKRTTPSWTPFEQGYLSPEYAARARAQGAVVESIFINSRYQVAVRELDSDDGEHHITHLSIKRRDKAPLRDWRDLQRIKNELCGPEREGFEIFPSESRLVDTANQYDMWVMMRGQSMSVGWRERLVAEGSMDGSVQRDFESKPFDLVRAEDLLRMEAVSIAKQTTEEERETARVLSGLATKVRLAEATSDELKQAAELLNLMIKSREDAK